MGGSQAWFDGRRINGKLFHCYREPAITCVGISLEDGKLSADTEPIVLETIVNELSLWSDISSVVLTSQGRPRQGHLVGCQLLICATWKDDSLGQLLKLQSCFWKCNHVQSKHPGQGEGARQTG